MHHNQGQENSPPEEGLGKVRRGQVERRRWKAQARRGPRGVR